MGRRGVKPANNRRVISGIPHILKYGCRLRDCPAVYGPPHDHLQPVRPLLQRRLLAGKRPKSRRDRRGRSSNTKRRRSRLISPRFPSG
jgi:transposase